MICTAYTGPLLDRYVLLVPSGPPWYGGPCFSQTIYLLEYLQYVNLNKVPCTITISVVICVGKPFLDNKTQTKNHKKASLKQERTTYDTRELQI